jgi:hypothetical protein
LSWTAFNLSIFSYNPLIVKQSPVKVALRFALCAAVLLIVAHIYSVIFRVNPTTVALTFLVFVLIFSRPLAHSRFQARKTGLPCSHFLPPR